MSFDPGLTLPRSGSAAHDQLVKASGLSLAEAKVYSDFVWDLESGNAPNHHLFGHAANIQGDTQLEAQLVSNGLYCGNDGGYEDARAQQLAKGADDWMLLLQLDSDQEAGFMWGDVGMLYFWIRKQDLAQRAFDRTWLIMQCC